LKDGALIFIETVGTYLFAERHEQTSSVAARALAELTRVRATRMLSHRFAARCPLFQDLTASTACAANIPTLRTVRNATITSNIGNLPNTLAVS
jgi:hypothetical protein